MPPKGISQTDWEATKAQALAVLAERASRKHRQMISYSELVAQIGPLRFEPRDQNLNDLLDEISTEEDRAGRGLISVLVVHKPPGDMMPGPGFFNLARARGRTSRDDVELWTAELKKVLAIPR